MKDLCLVFSTGALYRYPIFEQIGRNFNCDFYLGKLGDGVQKNNVIFDYNSLTGYKSTHDVKHIISNFYWQKNVVSLLFKPYKYYMFTGEPYDLSSWVFGLLAMFTKKKVMCWSHGWYGRENLLKRVLKKFYFRLFDELFLYNQYAVNLMKAEGFSETKLHCIYNSLDYEKQKRIREKLSASNLFSSHFGNDNQTLIYIGRIQKRKKIELILRAMSELNQEGYKTNLVIVGKDVDICGIDKEIERLELGKQVWLYGPCYDEERTGELFYNADVCVSPGDIGLTAIHALTYGCPIITHNDLRYQMPEFEAIEEGLTGAFFEHDNVKDLANVIRNWLMNNSENRSVVRERAYNMIDMRWNPYNQIKILKEVIR